MRQGREIRWSPTSKKESREVSRQRFVAMAAMLAAVVLAGCTGTPAATGTPVASAPSASGPAASGPAASATGLTSGPTLDTIRAKGIDMIGETIFNTPARAEVISFAEPLFFNPATLIVAPGNPKNLHQHSDFTNGVKICVIDGSLYLLDVQADQKNGQNVNSMVRETNDACMNAVVAGQADGALVDATQAQLAKKTKPDLAFDIITEFRNPD